MFPLKSKTTPSHIFKILHNFQYCGSDEWNVTKLPHVPVIYFMINFQEIFYKMKQKSFNKESILDVYVFQMKKIRYLDKDDPGENTGQM